MRIREAIESLFGDVTEEDTDNMTVEERLASLERKHRNLQNNFDWTIFIAICAFIWFV